MDDRNLSSRFLEIIVEQQEKVLMYICTYVVHGGGPVGC